MKMQLVELLNNIDHRILTFASYKTEDMIKQSMILTLAADNHLMDFTITSDKYGILSWINGQGVTKIEDWDGVKKNKDYGEKIITDVLDKLPDPVLTEYFEKAVLHKEFPEPLELSFQ